MTIWNISVGASVKHLKRIKENFFSFPSFWTIQSTCWGSTFFWSACLHILVEKRHFLVSSKQPVAWMTGATPPFEPHFPYLFHCIDLKALRCDSSRTYDLAFNQYFSSGAFWWGKDTFSGSSEKLKRGRAASAIQDCWGAMMIPILGRLKVWYYTLADIFLSIYKWSRQPGYMCLYTTWHSWQRWGCHNMIALDCQQQICRGTIRTGKYSSPLWIKI